MHSIAKIEIIDEVPWSEEFTPYDEAQFALYMRMLTAVREFMPEGQICSRILGIDAAKEPERAKKRFDNHLRRALWLATEGVHLIFPDKCSHCGTEHSKH